MFGYCLLTALALTIVYSIYIFQLVWASEQSLLCACATGPAYVWHFLYPTTSIIVISQYFYYDQFNAKLAQSWEGNAKGLIVVGSQVQSPLKVIVLF